MTRGAADHIVAIERGMQRDRLVKILAEFGAKLAQLIERKAAKLESLIQRKANRVADFFVCGAEGHALMHKICGRRHGIQEARLARRAHAVRVEPERTRKR